MVNLRKQFDHLLWGQSIPLVRDRRGGLRDEGGVAEDDRQPQELIPFTH